MEIIRSGGAFMSGPFQKINPAQWPRSESFAFFSSLDQPFYSVCFRVDVTALHAYTKANGLSFYHSMVWLVTQAVNETENLRYTLRGGEVYLLPARTPSFTSGIVTRTTPSPASPGANMSGRAAARRGAFASRSTTALSTACISAGSMKPCSKKSTIWINQTNP